ncbi:MAG: hypothetical protein HYR64_08470 [Fimbriimonas ginsengisoli]|uniref:RedB protein n=1 Tax=Fimbriimonas ginsengisoli TaxID=1005039 RepID=A0A931PU74_FIMGI|nr:hypothetical protein [Fimbriimonas ginsengisoli]
MNGGFAHRRIKWANTLVASAIALWTLALAAGFYFIERHANGSGQPASPPEVMAASLSAPTPSPKHRLLLFAHPQCPCTMATLEALDRLMATSRDQIDVSVYVWRPTAKTEKWAETALWERASRIPGARVILDPDGAEIRRYGARTSGQVLLYSPRGELEFSGGITPSRGHEGDCAGRDAITDALRGVHTTRTAPVFGCALQESTES